MRILIANDGVSDAGGVHAYLDAVIGPLQARGHQVALAFCTDEGPSDLRVRHSGLPQFALGRDGRRESLAALRGWAPDACFSHNMYDLTVERELIATAPTVKFMHGYFGTCVSGLKTHGFPSTTACSRAYGAACLALYYPRRCGQASPAVFLRSVRWVQAQRPLMRDYAAILVASRHMRDEYVRSGTAPDRISVNPLFTTRPPDAAAAVAGEPHVVFLGRMTNLKGGDLLLRSIVHANARLARPIRVTMIGDGPQRHEWEQLARSLHLDCRFTGWIGGEARWPLVREASVVALPSAWPEPFGLVGLEAGSLGVPAIAIDRGGVGEWLQDGTNGVLVPASADERVFGEALGALLGDPPRLRRLGAGALRVASRMSLDAHVSRLETILAGAARPAAA
jgi:glycosyltransferase involved in cell wall biosynthesis